MEAGIFEDLKEEHRKDSGLTREDIESLTVDENLTDLQRTQLFLSNNAHQLQQSCAFERLPKIFIDYGTAAYDALFPALASSMEHFNPHVQVLAGKAFTLIMQDQDVPKDMATWLLPMTLRMINLIQIYEVLQAWVEVLCILVPKLPSKDTDAEVRISMCDQLNAISRAVGIETTKRTVLPELYELLKDEEVDVHRVALTSLVEMLDFLPSDVKRLKILPILRLVCGQKDAKMLLPLSQLFGELMFKMAPDLSEEDIQLFVDSYKSLSRHSSEEVRQLCSHNFPAVLKSIGARKYAMTLHLTYQQLVQDPSSRVRCSISASFHEVSKILGKERAATYLKEAFLFLLTDKSREVQKKLIAILQYVIGQFSVVNEQQRMAIYASILPHLLQAEKDVTSFNLWRLQTSIFETFSQLIEYLTSDQIFEFLVPLCFYHMTESVLPVRSAAAITLAKFIRNNSRAMQRYELSQRVVKDFGHGRSYTARLVYIDFCESFLSISSSHMFKEHFLDAAISLLQDEVVGVRMRACALLPHLKAVVKLPEDAASLERINFYATQRLNDNDKQVAAAAKAVSDSFKHISVRCMGIEPGNENYAVQMEFEATDKQREEEEWSMLGKEEQDEQRKLDEMIQKLKLEGSKKFLMSTAAGPATGGAGEKATALFPSRNPAIAKFKSVVTSFNLGSASQSSVLKAAGSFPGAASPSIATLPRSPPILRTQGASIAKAINLQQGTVSPLAPSSSIIRTVPVIAIPAPSQVKAASWTETSEALPLGSGSGVASSKGTSKPNVRAARKSS